MSMTFAARVRDSADLFHGTVAHARSRSVVWDDPIPLCEARLFCENCGLQFLPVQSVCTRCGVTSTRHWFQLMSLVTLVIAATCNSLVACLLLPGLAAG